MRHVAIAVRLAGVSKWCLLSWFDFSMSERLMTGKIFYDRVYDQSFRWRVISRLGCFAFRGAHLLRCKVVRHPVCRLRRRVRIPRGRCGYWRACCIRGPRVSCHRRYGDYRGNSQNGNDGIDGIVNIVDIADERRQTMPISHDNDVNHQGQLENLLILEVFVLRTGSPLRDGMPIIIESRRSRASMLLRLRSVIWDKSGACC